MIDMEYYFGWQTYRTTKIKQYHRGSSLEERREKISVQSRQHRAQTIRQLYHQDSRTLILPVNMETKEQQISQKKQQRRSEKQKMMIVIMKFVVNTTIQLPRQEPRVKQNNQYMIQRMVTTANNIMMLKRGEKDHNFIKGTLENKRNNRKQYASQSNNVSESSKIKNVGELFLIRCHVSIKVMKNGAKGPYIQRQR